MTYKILIPLDGSKLAETAIDHAIKVADPKDSEFLLARVWTAISDFPYPLESDEWDVIRERHSAYIDQKVEELKARGLQVRGLVKEGAADEALISFAEIEDVDLIVMTSHGRSGLTRWILGSVAERVIRHAPCPVFILNRRTLKRLEEQNEKSAT